MAKLKNKNVKFPKRLRTKLQEPIENIREKTKKKYSGEQIFSVVLVIVMLFFLGCLAYAGICIFF